MLALLVEGHGEVAAVPQLVRRVVPAIDPGRPAEIRRPTRVNRSRLVKSGEFERYVELAARDVAALSGALLVLIDADDDCPASLGPALRARAAAERPDIPVGVVLATREFEAWFLATAESLRGHRGLPLDLAPPPEPESIRDAKGWLQDQRTDGFAYSATTDQPALAARMDLDVARERAPSFDKLWREVTRLMAATSGGP